MRKFLAVIAALIAGGLGLAVASSVPQVAYAASPMNWSSLFLCIFSLSAESWQHSNSYQPELTEPELVGLNAITSAKYRR